MRPFCWTINIRGKKVRRVLKFKKIQGRLCYRYLILIILYSETRQYQSLDQAPILGHIQVFAGPRPSTIIRISHFEELTKYTIHKKIQPDVDINSCMNKTDLLFKKMQQFKFQTIFCLSSFVSTNPFCLCSHQCYVIAS